MAVVMRFFMHSVNDVIHVHVTMEPSEWLVFIYVIRRRRVPKAAREKNCYVCEKADRIRMSFMTCAHCRQHFCSDHGTWGMEQCHGCLEDGEET
jgi:hypothetical protein